MSVIVKGMDMPKSCWRCSLSQLYENPREMLVCKITHEEVLRHKIDSNCPLIEIPPHGRLIVEDYAIETAWMILAGLGYRREENPQLEQTVREVYATAPTVWVE